MRIKAKQFGLSLTEVLTSIVIVVLLAAMSMPAINALVNSTSSTGSSEAMISAALSNARAIAMKEQRYAGVRFQNVYNPDNPLRAEQYMIFIIQEPVLGAYFFRAVNGFKPIRLPPNISVMDLKYRTITNTDPTARSDDLDADTDNELSNPKILNDITTFSIIFSPSGQLVIHDVRVRNKHGKTDDSSRDDIFNTQTKVENFNAMFYQDDYVDADMSFGKELSRRQFYIYEQDKFKRAYEQGTPYSGYLIQIQLKPVYLNSYTGTIIGYRE